MKYLLALFLLFLVLPARAEDSLPSGDFSELKLTESREVRAVVDPYTVQLEDGRLIRLAGIDAPDFNTYAPGPISQTAVKVLRDMLVGKFVNIYQSAQKDGGLKTRLGHHIAHLELKGDKVWVQGALLSLGLARVLTERSNTEMAGQMYALEAAAREKAMGLWNLKDYKILSPGETADRTHSLQVVEGKVVSTAMKQNRIYLNFGSDWRDDFTVTVAPEHKKRFFTADLNPLNLNNRTVRVRGWVESYNGPMIEIDHPERIEVLE